MSLEPIQYALRPCRKPENAPPNPAWLWNGPPAFFLPNLPAVSSNFSRNSTHSQNFYGIDTPFANFSYNEFRTLTHTEITAAHYVAPNSVQPPIFSRATFSSNASISTSNNMNFAISNQMAPRLSASFAVPNTLSTQAALTDQQWCPPLQAPQALVDRYGAGDGNYSGGVEDNASVTDSQDSEPSLSEIFGRVVESSKQQSGSRFIQMMLKTASNEEKEVVFGEIYPYHIEGLIFHKYGNHVIQAFLDLGTTPQKDMIAAVVVEQRLFAYVCHKYGCWVVQKVISYIGQQHKLSLTIIERLAPSIVECAKNSNASYVIQMLVQVMAASQLTFLPVIGQNTLAIATANATGCRLLQLCLQHVSSNYVKDLMLSIHRHTFELMEDQYGNYLIQFIIIDGAEKDKKIILSKITDRLVELSVLKYASNVCETALCHGDSKSKAKIIEKIMAIAPPDSDAPLVKMIKHPFANYVIQRSLEVAEGKQRQALYAQVRPIVTSLLQSSLTIKCLVDKFYTRTT